MARSYVIHEKHAVFFILHLENQIRKVFEAIINCTVKKNSNTILNILLNIIINHLIIFITTNK